MKHRAIVVTCALTFAAFIGAARNATADWPQWRGPNQDGISKEKNLLKTWPADGPQVLWRVPLGGGFSGLSVVDGKIYTMFSDDADEWAVCMNGADGKVLWKQPVGKPFLDKQGGDGPRSTPTVENGKVYVLGSRGTLACLNATDGKPVWSKDTVEEYGAQIPTWGISGSPVLDGAKLIVIVGGSEGRCVMAFNKADGSVIWKSLDDKPSYSTPFLMEVDGIKQAVCFTAAAAVGLARDDGRELWRFPWKTDYDINTAVPILHGNKLFIASGYKSGGALIEILHEKDAWTAKQVYLAPEMKNQFSTSVLIDGYLYGFNNDILTCMKFDTGDIMWTKMWPKPDKMGHGSILPADGRLVVLGAQSQLFLAEISSKAYKEISHANILTGRTWTIPTIDNGKMLLRNQTEVVCVNLKP